MFGVRYSGSFRSEERLQGRKLSARFLWFVPFTSLLLLLEINVNGGLLTFFVGASIGDNRINKAVDTSHPNGALTVSSYPLEASIVYLVCCSWTLKETWLEASLCLSD